MQTEERGEEGPFLKNGSELVCLAPPLVGGCKLETRVISLSVAAASKVAGGRGGVFIFLFLIL